MVVWVCLIQYNTEKDAAVVYEKYCTVAEVLQTDDCDVAVGCVFRADTVWCSTCCPSAVCVPWSDIVVLQLSGWLYASSQLKHLHTISTALPLHTYQGSLSVLYFLFIVIARCRLLLQDNVSLLFLWLDWINTLVYNPSLIWTQYSILNQWLD